MSPPIKKRALPIVCPGIDFELLCSRFVSNVWRCWSVSLFLPDGAWTAIELAAPLLLTRGRLWSQCDTELGAREHGRVILESACGPQHGVPRLLAPLGQLVLAMLCSIGREKLLQSRSSWSRRRHYLFMAVREAPSLRFQRLQR